MNIAEKALVKIKEYHTRVITGTLDSPSGYDAVHWLSGYIAALKENALIDEVEFLRLRDEIREIPIHSSSPRNKAELRKTNESNERSNSEDSNAPDDIIAKTNEYLTVLTFSVLAGFITALSFSGWAMLLMMFMLDSCGYFTDIVPAMSDMIWFQVAVPVSCVVLFWLVINSHGLSIGRSFVYWRRRFHQWRKS